MECLIPARGLSRNAHSWRVRPRAVFLSSRAQTQSFQSHHPVAFKNWEITSSCFSYWIFNRGIRGPKPLFDNLGIALHYPATVLSYLSVMPESYCPIRLLFFFSFYFWKLHILAFGILLPEPSCYILVILLKDVLYIQKINAVMEGAHVKQSCISGVKGR